MDQIHTNHRLNINIFPYKRYWLDDFFLNVLQLCQCALPTNLPDEFDSDTDWIQNWLPFRHKQFFIVVVIESNCYSNVLILGAHSLSPDKLKNGMDGLYMPPLVIPLSPTLQIIVML